MKAAPRGLPVPQEHRAPLGHKVQRGHRDRRETPVPQELTERMVRRALKALREYKARLEPLDLLVPQETMERLARLDRKGKLGKLARRVRRGT